MGRYNFSLTLTEPPALVQGSITVEAIDGGHGGLVLGDWDVDCIAEEGEPVLAADLGDADAIAAWVARRHSVLDPAITAQMAYLDPFEVAADTAACAQLRAWMDANEASDFDEAAEIEEHFLTRHDARERGRLIQ